MPEITSSQPLVVPAPFPKRSLAECFIDTASDWVTWIVLSVSVAVGHLSGLHPLMLVMFGLSAFALKVVSDWRRHNAVCVKASNVQLRLDELDFRIRNANREIWKEGSAIVKAERLEALVSALELRLAVLDTVWGSRLARRLINLDPDYRDAKLTELKDAHERLALETYLAMQLVAGWPTTPDRQSMVASYALRLSQLAGVPIEYRGAMPKGWMEEARRLTGATFVAQG